MKVRLEIDLHSYIHLFLPNTSVTCCFHIHNIVVSPVPPPSIDNQPLFLNEESQLYNIRKLVELPYSLARCGRHEELKKLLTNFNWLKACIWTTSCTDIVSNFVPILPVVPVGRSVSLHGHEYYHFHVLIHLLYYS